MLEAIQEMSRDEFDSFLRFLEFIYACKQRADTMHVSPTGGKVEMATAVITPQPTVWITTKMKTYHHACAYAQNECQHEGRIRVELWQKGKLTLTETFTRGEY